MKANNSIFSAVSCCLMMFFLSNSQATAQAFEWATKAGGVGRDVGFGITTNQFGEVYSCGYFSGELEFGNETLDGNNMAFEAYLSKTDPFGNPLWVVRGGGIFDDAAYAVTADRSGNVYTTGYFSDDADFEGTELNGAGATDIFVTAYTSEGELKWVKAFGGTGEDEAKAIVADDLGNLYVAGRFETSVEFGQTELNSTGESDVFLIKLDTLGNVLWARKAGGSQLDMACGIDVTPEGAVVLTGFYYNNITFCEINLIGRGSSEVFVAKYNADGSCAWAVSGGGTVVDAATAIAVDEAGNSFITGYYSGTAFFGDFSVRDYSYNDIFLAKYNAQGECEWLRRCGGEDLDIGTGVGTDQFGNVYLAGSYYGGITFGNSPSITGRGYEPFVSKYNADGDFLWVKNSGGGNSDLSKGLWVDRGGNAYMTGYYFFTITFGDHSLSTSSDADIYTVKISPGPENVGIVSQHIDEFDLRAYPNPTNGLVHINWKEFANHEVDFELFSLSGKLIERSELTLDESGSTKIHTDRYSAGVYILTLSSHNRSARIRLVVN